MASLTKNVDEGGTEILLAGVLLALLTIAIKCNKYIVGGAGSN